MKDSSNVSAISRARKPRQDGLYLEGMLIGLVSDVNEVLLLEHSKHCIKQLRATSLPSGSLMVRSVRHKEESSLARAQL